MRRLIRRLLAITVATAAAILIQPGVAAATLIPSNYATADAIGTVVRESLLGRSSCTLGQVTGRGSSAAINISAFNSTACTGLVSASTANKHSRVTVDPDGTISIQFHSLIVNTLGGECLYSGTLTGAASNDGPDLVVEAEGTMHLVGHLTGYCDSDTATELELTFPNLNVTKVLDPEAYETSDAEMLFTSMMVAGVTSCVLDNVSVKARGSTIVITDFTSTTCSGIIIDAAYNKPSTLNIRLDKTIGMEISILTINIFAGECLYSGILTGRASNSGADLTVDASGTMGLVAQLAPICRTDRDIDLSLSLPGVNVA